MATLLDLLDTARESPEQLATLLSASDAHMAMLYPDKSIIAIEQSVPLLRLETGAKRPEAPTLYQSKSHSQATDL